jgi:hypothetical protein
MDDHVELVKLKILAFFSEGQLGSFEEVSNELLEFLCTMYVA